MQIRDGEAAARAKEEKKQKEAKEAEQKRRSKDQGHLKKLEEVYYRSASWTSRPVIGVRCMHQSAVNCLCGPRLGSHKHRHAAAVRQAGISCYPQRHSFML